MNNTAVSFPSAHAESMPPARVHTLPSLSERYDAVVREIVLAEREIAAAEGRRTRLLAEAASLADRLAPADGTAATAPAREWARRRLAAEIGCATRRSESVVTRLVGEAEHLVESLPGTLDALACGDISYQHARYLVSHAVTLPEEHRAAFEEQALPLACELSPARFDTRARILRERDHPESLAVRAAAARRERAVWFEAGLDGMATLHHTLPAADALAIDDLIDRVARSLRTPAAAGACGGEADNGPAGACGATEGAGGQASATSTFCAGDPSAAEACCADTGATRGAGGCTGHAGGAEAAHDLVGEADARTHAQRRSDVLTDIVLGWSERPRIVPTVIVTVPAVTVAGASDEPGDLHGYGPIDPGTAREIAASAPTFLRALIAPDGSLLSVTRRRYRPTAELRTVLMLDDETCRFPGCGRRASRCELDHTKAWAEGGETIPENLAHLCPRHHHLKHEGGWRVEMPATGTRDLLWTSPRGVRYLTRPNGSTARVRPPNAEPPELDDRAGPRLPRPDPIPPDAPPPF